MMTDLAWIPICEQLPHPPANIPLLVVTTGIKYPMRAVWVPKFSQQTGCDDEGGEYSEEEDEYYLEEGWYEWNQYEETHWLIEKPVTHWMYLPERQK